LWFRTGGKQQKKAFLNEKIPSKTVALVAREADWRTSILLFRDQVER
jgi:hypothetical protein